MCLIGLAWQAHPDYLLVLAANRDEYHARPTRAVHWWAEPDGVLAGQDLAAGGTWMGLHRTGRLAALTNLREPAHAAPGKPSRGQLVLACLRQRAPATAVLADVRRARARYAGFNLLVGDLLPGQAHLGLCESRSGRIVTLTPGLHALSNGPLDDPWPKSRELRSALAHTLTCSPCAQWPADLIEALRDARIADDDALPRTGVSLQWERWLSARFVRAPGYGTRSSTVLTVTHDGGVHLIEQHWDERGDPGNRCELRFRFGGEAP